MNAPRPRSNEMKNADPPAWLALRATLPAPPDFRFDWRRILALPPLAAMIERMRQTPQDPQWHGEGDVWTHTRMVCDALTELAVFRRMEGPAREALALAALLHDAGKPRCTRMENGRLVSPHHGAVGAQLIRALLWTDFGLCGTPEKQRLREACCWLIRYHTMPLHLWDREDAALCVRRVAAIGELAPAFSFAALLALGEADARGRVCGDRDTLLDQLALSRELALEAGCLDAPYPFASPMTRAAYFRGAKVWPDQELYDDTFGEVVLMCGLPGVGKDTYIRERFPGLPVVSLDALRTRMGVTARDEQGAVVQAAREEARGHLRRGQPFVWNATSLTDLRRKQLSLFEQYHARTRIVYLETSWPENLRRNQARPERVPEGVLADMLAKLQPPLLDEATAVEWVCV